jgi:hypothetical protein
MKTYPICVLAAFILLVTTPGSSQDVKTLLKGAFGTGSAGTAAGAADVAAGLKEALAVGTGNAVRTLSKANGYFGDAAVRILMPEKLRTAADLLGKAGYQQQVDDFVLSMKRAAEQSAPMARPIFEDAVRKMTFEDAEKILNGGNTAATDYFKSKTTPRLTEAFRPVIAERMNQAGTTRSYKALTDRYRSVVPFGGLDALDLDDYVTRKSLDGLFFKVGQEEAKIRSDPAARTTDLLRAVFAE